MFYRIDGHNCIVEVDDGWDDFAVANGGNARATRAAVVGQPVTAFVAGDTTRMFVHAALDAARLLGQTRALPYRCDSPTERRHFQMLICPEPHGHLRVEHRLVSSQARRAPPLLLPGTATACRCSQCLAARPSGAARRISADQADAVSPATGICPDCARRLLELIGPNPGIAP